MSHDLHLDLSYSIQDKSATILYTNIRESYIDDFLGEVVHAQSGRGADNSEANQFETYQITLRCNLAYDNISINSNTGNKGLTAGILTHSIGNWRFSDSFLESKAKAENPNFIGPLNPSKIPV